MRTRDLLACAMLALILVVHAARADHDENCIDPIDRLVIQYMGDVVIDDALTDDLGSLLITTKAEQIVEIRLTMQSLSSSGVAQLFPADTDSFRVWLYNSNRVFIDPVSEYEVSATQGWALFEPGGAGDILLMIGDGASLGAGTGPGTIDLCDHDDDGPGPGCDNPFDRNCDGVVDLLDLIDFMLCVMSGDPECDFNGDGIVDLQDLLDFLDQLNDDDDGEPCP